MSDDGRRRAFIQERRELWSGELVGCVSGEFVVKHVVYLLRYRVWEDEFGRFIYEQIHQTEEQKDIIGRLFDQILDKEVMSSELLAASSPRA